MTDTATVTLPLYPRMGHGELAEHLTSWAPGPAAAGVLAGGTALATSWSAAAIAVIVSGLVLSAVMWAVGCGIKRLMVTR